MMDIFTENFELADIQIDWNIHLICSVVQPIDTDKTVDEMIIT